MSSYDECFAVAFSQRLQEAEQVLAAGGIQVLGGLVEEPEDAILNQTLCQPDHLAFATAEVAHPLRDGFAEAYLLQRLPGAIVVRFSVARE